MKRFSTILMPADKYHYFCITIFCTALTLFSLPIPFFWDNVYLVSKIAYYYYENSFPSVVLPLELDSGHPPFYPLYMATVWSCFGKTLAVSHWTVFPFLVGSGIAYYQLTRYFLPHKAVPFALLLWAIEPTLLAQSALGGIDIALTCLYLAALCGIFYHRRWLLTLALCGMAAFSLRGIIAVGLLGLTEFLTEIFNKKHRQDFFLTNRGEVDKGMTKKMSAIFSNFIFQTLQIVRKIAPAYLPPIFLIGLWLCYHYQVNGFLTSNPDSPWAKGYGFVNFHDWTRNLLFMAWRILDYGRLILWGITFLLLLKYQITNFEYRISNIEYRVSNTEYRITNYQSLILYIVLPLIFYLPFITLRYTDILHRYFLPTYLLVSILFVALWFKLEHKKIRVGILALVIGGLLSGHFWQYPDRFPNGSDASLSFVPYFGLEEKMREYIGGKNIDFEEVGTEFPAVNARKFTHLEAGNLSVFSDKDTRSELLSFPYILESNLMNNFDIKDLNKLRAVEGGWNLEKEFCKGQVYMRLYKRNQDWRE